MPISNLETRRSGYFFDGGEGKSIFVFLSRQLPFYSKPDFCVICTQMTIKRPQFTPLGPDDGGMESHKQENDSSNIAMVIQ